MYSWNAVPENWEHLSHRPSNTTIDLSVVLKPHSGSALINALHEVNDLGKNQSSIYIPSHLTESHCSLDRSLAYRTALNLKFVIPDSSTTTSLMRTRVSVSRANDLLDTLYQLYRHAKMNEIAVRMVDYALPTVLRGHVLQRAPRKRAGRATAERAKVAPGKPVTVPSRRNDDDACGISRRLTRASPSRDQWLTTDECAKCPGPVWLVEVTAILEFPYHGLALRLS
ncbi:hypothetical protein EDB89DRAFT_1910673 [Lactarius sanguifluus]|nr:hypothetical protein EDB89DRAFT_1910673 [Lactarius sanguifluus]